MGDPIAASELVAPPFIVKTYQMVNDPATDPVIAWGSNNNSFVVVDPFLFSQTLLPTYFKHSNFSSFVRQLNTYGFRKIALDKLEFAHASFLRGQKHLLHFIVRRGIRTKAAECWEVEENMAAEVVKLKQEQRGIEEQVRTMLKQVQEKERWPKQMMAFLLGVMGNQQLLSQLVDAQEGGQKRPRREAAPELGPAFEAEFQFDGVGGEQSEGDYSSDQFLAEEQVRTMLKQVQEKERWPKQMMALLLGVMGNQQLLSQLVDAQEGGSEEAAAGGGTGVGAGVRG